MAKYGEDDINVLHPSLRSIYTKPEKSLGLDKDKITIDLLRDVFRKNCINLIPEFAQSGKAKLTAKQLILAYHLSRGTVKGTANQIRDLMESSPYFDFQPEYMLPILRPVKSNVEYCKKSRGFRMLAVVYAGEEAFNMSKLLDWSFSFTFHVEYVLRRHKITKTYEEFAKFNSDLESELLSLPAFPDRKNLDKNALGMELQEYICRLHHSLAERGVFSPRLMQFLGVDFERVQSEEEGAFVLALDTPALIPNTAWHFIDEKWLESWRVYVRGRPPRRYYPPGTITNDRIFTVWKAYDDALQAAQRAEAEEHHLQQLETVGKSTFATRVMKLAKESAKLASLHARTKKSTRHHKHLNEVLLSSNDKPNRHRLTNGEDEKVNNSEDESDENEGGEESSSGNSDGSGNLTDIDEADDEEDDDAAEEEKELEVRVNPDAVAMQHEEKSMNTNDDATLTKQLSTKQTMVFSTQTDSPARQNKRRNLRLLKRLKKHKVAVKQKTYVELPAKLEVIKDYRVVNYNVWRFLQLVHGGGPVISRELPDLYAPKQFSFLQAVIFIQTRIRVKLAQMALQRLQMRKMSQTYAGKLLLVSEAKQCIADRATRQLESLRQSRLTKNLDIAATFTQNLWRLKKHYYNEEALEAKQREQAAFARVHTLQNDLPLSSNTTRDGQQIVLDRKPIIQIGNAQVYTVVFSDSDAALPFTLSRALGTEQAIVAMSNDERRVALQSILLSINGIPTNTLSFEDVKKVLSHASTPLKLEFMRPYETRLLPTLLNLIDMKLQGAGKFAMYTAFKLALLRGIRLIKHHVNGKGIFCTSHRTILKINDKELMYQSHVVKPQFYHTISPAILFANKLTKSNNSNLFTEQAQGEQSSIVLPYDPEKQWVRFSLFDIKFIREGRESEIIQSRKLSPFHALMGQGLHPSRCFEIVLEDRVLAFEFPSLRDEEQFLRAELMSLEDAMQRVEEKRELLESKTTHNSSSRSNNLGPGNLTRSVTLQLKTLVTQVHRLQQYEIVNHSEEKYKDDNEKEDDDEDEKDDTGEKEGDEEESDGSDHTSESEVEHETARTKLQNSAKNSNNHASQSQRQQFEMKEETLADLYACKRQLLTEKHMVERELLELETLRTYLTALRVRPIVDPVAHTVKYNAQEAKDQNEEKEEEIPQKMGAAAQDMLLLPSEEDDGLHHHLWDTFVDITSPNANVSASASASQENKHKYNLFTRKQQAVKTTNNSNNSANEKKSASTNVDVDNDNQDFDEQDLAFCLKFQRDPSNDAFLYKRIVMTNLKRLVEEIRSTQVFVNKLGLPVRRRQQKTALKRVGGQDT